MKKDLTELVFVLDKSGSMRSLTSETIKNFNQLIEDQKKDSKDCRVSLLLFDNQRDLVYQNVTLNEVPELTAERYSQNGMGYTALLDSLGGMVYEVGRRLYNTPEHDRPEQVIFVVMTDGLENASRDYTKDQVAKMVKIQQDKYNWKFMFLGANFDAFNEAQQLGFMPGSSTSYKASTVGTQAAYIDISHNVRKMRATASASAGEAMAELDWAQTQSELDKDSN